ncbi:MAG: PD-(D/E)XK nuclease family protein [Bacteroidetes bacterium]|nr:PD-(D/E)XK nuclease family protein [Bacteroidota bacterium]
MDKESIKNFIERISQFVTMQEKINALTGESFNVFNILDLSTNEVRTHSAFLAELLNPKGSHGQKETFLNLFTEQMKIIEFNCLNARVQIEKRIGYISESKTEGGNIDIIISDNQNNAVIIENKIYAGDQDNQLLRYFNYGKKNYNSFKLYYLTLDGNDASWSSKQDLKAEDYHKISYSQDIIEWLERCIEKSSNQPILRETINQYVTLVKQLTNQSTNHIMKEEIVKAIVANDNSIKSLFEIQKHDIIGSVKKELIDRFKNQLNDLAKEHKLKFEAKGYFDNNPSYFTFYLPNSSKGFYISFGFCTHYNNMFYVVNCIDEFKESCKEEVCKRLGDRDNGFNEIWIKWFENDLRNWNNSAEPWLQILDHSLKENFRGKLSYILNSLQGFEI